MVKLFVGNLPNDCARRDVVDAFEKHGKVTECDIIRNYAFVHIDELEDAEAAIKALHNTEFLGSEITVEISTSRPRNTCKIYIGNLSSSASADELQRMFEEFGEVVECDIIKDFAFCHMTSRREAEKAIRELNDESYMGRRLKVQHANNNDRRGNDRDRGNGQFYNGMNIYSRQYRDFYDRQGGNRGGRGRYAGGGGGGGNWRRSPPRRRRRSRSYSRSRSRSRSRSESPRRRRRRSTKSRSPSRSGSRSRSRSKSRSRS